MRSRSNATKTHEDSPRPGFADGSPHPEGSHRNSAVTFIGRIAKRLIVLFEPSLSGNQLQRGPDQKQEPPETPPPGGPVSVNNVVQIIVVKDTETAVSRNIAGGADSSNNVPKAHGSFKPLWAALLRRIGSWRSRTGNR